MHFSPRTVGTRGLLLVLRVAEPTGRFVIPLGGMILGNAMNITSQTLNRFRAELRARRAEVETLFSLGASRQQAAFVEGRLRADQRQIVIIDDDLCGDPVVAHGHDALLSPGLHARSPSSLRTA